MKKEKVYMKVTRDKFELPICVATSVEELSRKTNDSRTKIRNTIKNSKRRGAKKCIYQEIEIENE